MIFFNETKKKWISSRYAEVRRKRMQTMRKISSRNVKRIESESHYRGWNEVSLCEGSRSGSPTMTSVSVLTILGVSRVEAWEERGTTQTTYRITFFISFSFFYLFSVQIINKRWKKSYHSKRRKLQVVIASSPRSFLNTYNSESQILQMIET